jgi:hypothetical protein
MVLASHPSDDLDVPAVVERGVLYLSKVSLAVARSLGVGTRFCRSSFRCRRHLLSRLGSGDRVVGLQ